jgi:hypothetical protein
VRANPRRGFAPLIVALTLGVGLIPSVARAWTQRLGVRTLRGYPVVQRFGPYAPWGVPPGVVVYGPSYGPMIGGPGWYQPIAPVVVDPDRNWRDTWQDDGVKVHGYTLR